MAGLWELPWIELPSAEVDPAFAEPALAERYGARWTLGPRLGAIRHGITFRNLEIVLHRATVHPTGHLTDSPQEAAWIPRQDLPTLPLSSMVPKALKAIP